MPAQHTRLLITAISLAAAATATAADLYWDGTSTGPGADGGDGTWNLATVKWYPSADGGTASAWKNTNKDTAIFGGTAGKVTITSNITASEVRFLTSGYTLETVAGTGTRTLNLGLINGNATLNITVGTGATDSVNFAASDWSAFTGTLNLLGTQAASGNAKISAAAGAGLTAAATVNVGAHGTLYVTGATAGIATTHAAAITLAGGDTGESNGQLRLENAEWSGAITLAGDMAAGDSFIGTNGAAGTISGVIGESGGSRALSKGGSGTIILTGNNTYSGITRINGGFLSVANLGNAGAASNLGTHGTIDFVAGTGGLIYTGTGETTDKVIRYNSASAGGVLTNNGTGTLVFTNTFTTTATGAFGVTFNGTGNTRIVGIANNNQLINFNKQGTGTVTVTGSLDLKTGALRADGGILRLESSASTGSGANAGTFTRSATGRGVLQIAAGAQAYTTSLNTNGILGGWAAYGDNSWAVANGATTAVSGLTTGTADTWSATTNTDVTLAGANPGADATTYTLRFNEAGAKTLTLTGDNTLAGSGLMVTGAVGANTTTITGGTLTAGAPNASTDLIVHQYNTGGHLRIASTIINNGTGTTSLTKVGAGTLILTGANTYTGGTVVSAGTLAVGDGTGAGSVLVGAAGVTIASGATLVVDGGTLTLTAANASMINNGTLTFIDAVLDLGGKFDGFVGTEYQLTSGTGSTTGSVLVTGFDKNSFSGVSFDTSTGKLSFAAIPEPSTYGLLGAGAAAAAAMLRRRKKRA